MKHKRKCHTEHLNKVADLCCIACRKIGYDDTPAEIHHIRAGKGLSQRASHFETIPLCPHHHRHGYDAVHVDKRLFERKFGTELELLEQVRAMI